MIRSAAPQGYEKTINDFFAFRIRGPQDNAVIGLGPPEPGACPLDGYSASSRGWVVPTVYETRTREPSGQGAVSVTSKQYFFWFLGSTIAGISPRIDLCPGVGVTFGEDASPKQVAQGSATATAPGGQKQDEADEASAAPAVAQKYYEEARRPSIGAPGQSRAAKQTRARRQSTVSAKQFHRFSVISSGRSAA